MASKREEATAALFSALSGIIGAEVVRNEFGQETIPAGGRVIVSEGDLPEPEATLSPASYYYEQMAHVHVFVEAATSSARDTRMDEILEAIDTAIQADTTLGGKVDLAVPHTVDFEEEAVIGGQDVKGALVHIALFYTTTSPLA